MPTAKPTASLGPFGEGGKPAASLCQHGALQSLAKAPGASDTRVPWDMPAPGLPLNGALPSGYPSSQKLTGTLLGGIPGGKGRRRSPRRAVGLARGRRRGHPCPETSPWLCQGQTCWRSTCWRSAACASAWRSPSAPTTGSGSSWSAAWPLPARPAVRGCSGASWGRGVAGFAHPHCTGKSPRPLRGVVLRRGAQHPSPVAGLPGDVFAQGPELGLQLSGENRALREDNQSLRLQCDRLSRGRAGTNPSGSESLWGHPAR